MPFGPPFHFNEIPGIYGPFDYPIKKIGNGYCIEYNVKKFEGSIREIAEQVFMQFLKLSEHNPHNNCVSPFIINLEPEIKIYLVMHAIPDPPELDVSIICKEITEAFKSLLKLTTFF